MAANSISGARRSKRPSLASSQRTRKSDWHRIQNLSSAVRVSSSAYLQVVFQPSCLIDPAPFPPKKVIPAWSVSCRRLTPGPGYFEALCSDNVSISDLRPRDPFRLPIQSDTMGTRRRSKRPKLRKSCRQASSCATDARTSWTFLSVRQASTPPSNTRSVF
jgi:hypothetical protein